MTRHDWVDKGIHWELLKKISIRVYEQIIYAQPNISPGEWQTKFYGILTYKWIIYSRPDEQIF